MTSETGQATSPEMDAALEAAFGVYQATGSLDSIRDATAFVSAFSMEAIDAATLAVSTDDHAEGIGAKVCVDVCKTVKGIEVCFTKCFGK